MPIDTTAMLEMATLSRVLENVKTPWSFILQMLYGNRNTNPTSTIEIGTVVGGRRMAPFVTPGAGAAMVPGTSVSRRNVTAPCIRGKRPFTSQQLLANRDVGMPIFVNSSGQLSDMAMRKIARDLKFAREQIDQTMEWMACQTLEGVLTYNIADANGQPGDAFTIDFGRPGAHTVVLSGTDTWDTAKASATSQPREHIETAQELVTDAIGAGLTDCILGVNAAKAFASNEFIREDLDNRRILPGTLDLQTKFRDMGALFYGEIYGIRFWRYNRTCQDPYGSTVQLIHPDKAFFVSATPNAENIIEFGAVDDDIDALEANMIETQYFSKSWRQQDPSALMYLWESRPLPIPRRPESMYEMTVV